MSLGAWKGELEVWLSLSPEFMSRVSRARRGSANPFKYPISNDNIPWLPGLCSTLLNAPEPSLSLRLGRTTSPLVWLQLRTGFILTASKKGLAAQTKSRALQGEGAPPSDSEVNQLFFSVEPDYHSEWHSTRVSIDKESCLDSEPQKPEERGEVHSKVACQQTIYF